jgi:hypothetical protein
VVEDGPGAVPELDAEVVAATPVGLKAEQAVASDATGTGPEYMYDGTVALR